MTGGGTAGHVTPNIALKNALLHAGYTIEYIGTVNGIEKSLIKSEGIPYNEISAGKLRRYFDFKNITDIFKITKGFFQANSHIRKIKPNIVFSKGGFVSCPVVWAAKINKIPVIIHESDITPGLANKLCLPFAEKICYSNPKTAEYLPKNKSVFTGIPVREELLYGLRDKGCYICGFNNNKPIILVTGGSLGAKAINKALRNNLDILLKNYQVCHITGQQDYLESLENKVGYKQIIYAKDELKDLFAMADIVISRAGATTLFEILALEKPNILIPLPKKVSRGDQILNAKFFEEKGYSVVLEEEIANDCLITTIENLVKDKQLYINAMRKSEIKNSISQITEIIRNASRN